MYEYCTHCSTVPQWLVVILVRNGLSINDNVSRGRLLDAEQPGAALAQRSRHVVREQVCAAALAGLAEAKAADTFALRTGLTVLQNKIITIITKATYQGWILLQIYFYRFD